MKHRRPNTLEPISPAVFLIVSLHAAAVLGVWWSWQNVKSAQRAARERQLAWMSPADFKNTAPPPAVQPRQPKVAATAAKTPPKTSAVPAPKPQATAQPSTPGVQKATLVAAPPSQHVMEPVAGNGTAPLFAPPTPAAGPAANRSITLRRAQQGKGSDSTLYDATVPPMTSPTLMDIARLNAMRPTAVPPPGSLKSAPEEEDANLDKMDEAVNTAFLAAWTAPPISSVPESQREARLSISIGRDGTVLKAQMGKFSGSHALDESILEAAVKVKKISATLPSNYTKESYDLELNFLLLP